MTRIPESRAKLTLVFWCARAIWHRYHQFLAPRSEQCSIYSVLERDARLRYQILEHVSRGSVNILWECKKMYEAVFIEI